MDFKVGDIITFDRSKYDSFRPFMYNKKHVITRIEDTGIWTKGFDFTYKDFCDHEELRTKNNEGQWRAIIKCERPKRWTGSKIKFNFFAEDVDSLE